MVEFSGAVRGRRVAAGFALAFCAAGGVEARI